MDKKLHITELVLRDGQQSLLATRLRLDDMLPIAAALDEIGYWSIESWGGATFDACIRFLGEDPWQRLRELKKAMPKTPQQMLLRGQNLLGYRHYADDVVHRFVERAAENGIDIFRIFDAMNDVRNLQTAIAATIAAGKHAQGTLSYTTSPVHTLDTWLQMARQLEDMGCHSICIKDMSGILQPLAARELVSRLKETITVPLAMQSHATTGLSTATTLAAVEAGLDMVDSAISSMSMTYGHSATETVVSMFQDSAYDSGLDLAKLAHIADYFRDIRTKYRQFEGSLQGIDARILIAQVPGGMLTNMENQLREQGMAARFAEVLDEVPRVRADLGYIPLVTPTSQIVGTQAVLNVLHDKRYHSISRETAAICKGEYGATPAPIDAALKNKVLQGQQPITDRPADHLAAEMERLRDDWRQQRQQKHIRAGENEDDDALICALFPQIGLKFLINRDNPEAFEAAPGEQTTAPSTSAASKHTNNDPAHYQVRVDGQDYAVEIRAGKEPLIAPSGAPAAPPATNNNNAPAAAAQAETVAAPLAGNIFKLLVHPGQAVKRHDLLIVLEAMKMETEIKASRDGRVDSILVSEGDAVKVDSPLLTLLP